MIGIMHRNGTVYRFANEAIAMEWLYDNEDVIKDITVFSDKTPKNSIALAGSLYMRQCKSCDTLLKFEIDDDEHVDLVICPKCQCRSKL